jgi:hypothetical protein
MESKLSCVKVVSYVFLMRHQNLYECYVNKNNNHQLIILLLTKEVCYLHQIK